MVLALGAVVGPGLPASTASATPVTIATASYEPTGFGTTPWLSDGATIASITTANWHSGDWSLALTSKLSGYWVGVSEEMTGLTVGRDYTITAWVDASASTGLSDISLDVHGVGKDTAGTSGWEQLTYTFTATDVVQEWSLGNNDATPTSGPVYWDDLALEQDAYTDGSGSHPAVPIASNGYELSGFGQVPWLNDGSTIASVTTANSKNGDWSLALSSQLTGYWVGMWDTLTGLTVGDQYTLSAWVDASGTTGLSDIGIGIDGGSTHADTTGWEHITYSFEATDTEMEWGFGHGDASPTSGAVYWDDVTLEVEGAPLEPAIVLDLDDLSNFADSNAQLVTVDSDETDGAERTVVGTTFAGDPVQIKVYSTASTSTDLDALADLTTSPPTQSTGQPDEVDEESLEPTLATAVTPTTMTFAWKAPLGADEFSVVLNGVAIESGASPEITLRGLAPDTLYDVQLLSDHTPSDPPASDQDIPVSSTMTLPMRTPAYPISLRGGSVSSLFDDPGALVTSTEINYRTFIPYEKLSDSTEFGDAEIVETCIGLDWFDKIPDTTGYDFTFLGDNRGFAPPPASGKDYRTMMDYRVDWVNQTDSYLPDTGITTVYNTDLDQVWETDQAPTTNMVFGFRAISPTYATVTFDHIANDPFCPSGAMFGGSPGWNPVYDFGAITYIAKFDMFRSGLVIVTGIRAAMPAHEAYVRWNDQSSWSGLFAMDPVGLRCLAITPLLTYPVCADTIGASISRSQERWKDISFDEATIGTTTAGRTWATGSNSGWIMSPFTEDTGCTVETFVPVPPEYSGYSRKTVAAMASESHATLLNNDGIIYTWGLPLWSGANLGHAGEEPAPVSTTQFIDFDVSEDGLTTFAISTSGDLYTWGLRIKDWSTPSADYNYTPTVVATGFDLVKVQIDSGTVIALDEDGKLWGYGDNALGLLGSGPSGWTVWNDIPVSGVDFTTIAMVGDSAFALDDSGQLWEWGKAALALDGSSATSASSPTLVDTSLTFDRIDVGSSDEVGAVATDGTTYSWSRYASRDDIMDWQNPSWSEDIVMVKDLHAITASGELLKFNYNTLAWDNYGLPPISYLYNPPMTCNSASRP